MDHLIQNEIPNWVCCIGLSIQLKIIILNWSERGSWNSIQNCSFELSCQSNAANSSWNLILNQLIRWESVCPLSFIHSLNPFMPRRRLHDYWADLSNVRGWCNNLNYEYNTEVPVLIWSTILICLKLTPQSIWIHCKVPVQLFIFPNLDWIPTSKAQPKWPLLSILFRNTV